MFFYIKFNFNLFIVVKLRGLSVKNRKGDLL